MIELQLGLKTKVFVSENGRINWPIHRRAKVKRKFITYFGADTKRELVKLLKELEFEKYEIRAAKRLTSCKYEAKVWGLLWDDVLSIAPNL